MNAGDDKTLIAHTSNAQPHGSPFEPANRPSGSNNAPDSNSTDRVDPLERRNLRRMQVMMQLLLSSIQQDRSLSVDDAAQMVANTRNAVLRMFPGKEETFRMLCRPRIQRAMRERFKIQ
jgi:hypothetical protein